MGRASEGGAVAGVRGSQQGDREARRRRQEPLGGKWAEPAAAEGAQGGLSSGVGLAQGGLGLTEG